LIFGLAVADDQVTASWSISSLLHEEGETHHLVIRTVYRPMTKWASWQRRAIPAALQAGADYAA